MGPTAGEGEAADSPALPPLGPAGLRPRECPPGISALTKAVQDVVEIVEIIVAVLHDRPVAHRAVAPAVGVCHCACAGRGDGQEGRSQHSGSPQQDKMFKETKV